MIGYRLKRGIVLGCTLGLTAFAPLAAKAETLADALVSAYNHSGLIDQNRALLRAADEDVAVAVSALRPIINWTGSVKRTFSRAGASTALAANTASTTASIGLAAELMLFDHGQSRFAIDAAKENVLATRERLLSVEQSVLLRAVSAYMSVIRETETVALRHSNVRLITQELRAARDRFAVGEITRTDVALAEARLAAARSGLAAAEGLRNRAIEEYRAAVGRKPGKLRTPGRLPQTAKSVEQGKSIAVRTHPDLKAIQHDVSAADLTVARAEAAMKPTLRLRGGLNVTETFDSGTFSRGGSVSLEAGGPIYQGGRLSALVRQSMARRDAARASLHVARHTVQQNVGNAFSDLRVMRASIEASERQIRAARVAFRGVREEANVGSRTTLDVLNAEQELLNARSGLIAVQSDQITAAYSALSAMGLLTAKHLNLPVQQYDPAAYYNMVKDGPAKRSKQGAKLDKVLKALGKN